VATGGALRVVSEGELQTQEAEQASAEFEASQEQANSARVESSIGNHIRKRWDEFKRHRTSEDITQRLLANLRQYDGTYDSQKMTELKEFGGSNVFARITSVKCRGATALLRDIYMSAERPWNITPTPVPDLPDSVLGDIDQLLQGEIDMLVSRGVEVNPSMLAQRRQQLMSSAYKASLKSAKREAKTAETKLDDILVEGRFYEAFTEFLIDLPIFQYAGIKGPVVQMTEEVSWENGVATRTQRPRMFWYRVSPFDLYFTPGAINVEDSEVIERSRLRRAELQALIGVPDYDDEAIRDILRTNPNGWSERVEEGDAERAELESREDPVYDHGWYDTLEYHGAVQGQQLLDFGISAEEVPDAELDYFVTAWLVGRRVIKVQINPNSRRRPPYYITSYEKMPGSMYGNGIPDIISDIQDVANASFRSLVNNMSISSGPQVAINDDRLHAATDPDTLYPWKRWRFTTDPLQTNAAEKPIDFFQPQSNAQELLGVYKQMSELADEISAIPKYMTGSEKVGGAARTASGLSMLMNNTSKVLQMIAANIDTDIMSPCLKDLYELMLLTDDAGMFRGDEKIQVRGVSMAVKQDTDRMRQMEFLQITANPMDQQIIGQKGRATILRNLADNLGLPEEEIIPTEAEIEQAVVAEQQQMLAAAQAQGNQPPMPGNAPQQGMGEETDNAFRTQMG
jgi:hypothetical protein